MTLLDLRHALHGAVEGLQRHFPGVRQPHFHKGHMRQPHADRVQHRPVTGDHPGHLQPFDPGLRRRLAQPDAARQFGDRHAPVAGQFADNRGVETVDLGWGLWTVHCSIFGQIAYCGSKYR